MEGKILARFSKFFDEIIEEEIQNGNLARGSTLHLNIRVHDRVTQKAKKMMDNYRLLNLKCHSRERRGRTVKAASSYINYMTAIRPVSSFAAMGTNNFHRPLFEWIGQGITESIIKIPNFRKVAGIFSQPENSTLEKLTHKYAFSRVYGVMTGLILAAFFGTAEKIEVDRRFEAMRTNPTEALNERQWEFFMTALEESLNEKKREYQERMIQSETRAHLLLEDIERINWDNFSASNFDNPTAQSMIQGAIATGLYEENAGNLVKTGNKALDFFLFNALYGLFSAWPEFRFYDYLYKRTCFELSGLENFKIKSVFIQLPYQLFLDWFVFFPVRSWSAGV